LSQGTRPSNLNLPTHFKRMSELSSDSLQPFFADLRAAVRAGVELEIGDGESPARALSLKKLERIEQEIEGGDPGPKRIQASIDTWRKTGSRRAVVAVVGVAADQHAFPPIADLRFLDRGTVDCGLGLVPAFDLA